jgi:hypothetical protein
MAELLELEELLEVEVSDMSHCDSVRLGDHHRSHSTMEWGRVQ